MIDFLDAALGLFYFGLAMLQFGCFAIGLAAFVGVLVQYVRKRLA